jgi:hypothetical protein
MFIVGIYAGLYLRSRLLSPGENEHEVEWTRPVGSGVRYGTERGSIIESEGSPNGDKTSYADVDEQKRA